MRHRLQPIPMLGLALVWVMLTGKLTGSSVVYGLLVAAAILWIFPMPPLMSTVRIRPVGMVVLLSRFLADLFKASFWVAWLALRPRPIGPGSLVDVKLRLEDDLRRTVVASFTSLVPGTVVLDVDPRTSIMTIHVVDTSDPVRLAEERARIRELEDRVEAALHVVAEDPGTGSTDARVATTAGVPTRSPQVPPPQTGLTSEERKEQER